MIVAMIVVFYIFLIRPQSQQAKEEAKYRDGLKPGDRIMTASGLHGSFVSADGIQIVLEVAPGTRIKVAKSSVQPIPERKSTRK